MTTGTVTRPHNQHAQPTRHPIPHGQPPIVGEPHLCSECNASMLATLYRPQIHPDQLTLAITVPDPHLTQPPAPPANTEEVTTWIRRWLIVYHGVITNHRPRQQLLRWTTAEIYNMVSRRQALTARRDSRNLTPTPTPRIHSVHVSTPAPSIHEIAVITRTTTPTADRFEAIALRVETTPERTHTGTTRTRVTAFE